MLKQMFQFDSDSRAPDSFCLIQVHFWSISDTVSILQYLYSNGANYTVQKFGLITFHIFFNCSLREPAQRVI